MSSGQTAEPASAPGAPRAAPVDERHLCDELLSPHERIARRELPRWCEDLARDLAAAGPSGPADRIAVVFNQAALVAAHLGRFDDAERLCDIELRWLAARADATGDASIAVLALQPVVNLVRLDRIRGRAEESLSRLDALAALRAAGEIAIGPLAITPRRWNAMRAAAPGIERSLFVQQIIEELKTLLRARRHERVLAAVRRQDVAAEPSLAGFRQEAAISALCRVGQRDAALALAERCASSRGPEDRPRFELRWAEALAAFGSERAARERARALGAGLEERLPVEIRLDDLFLVARTARLLAALGEVAGAAALARPGIAAAAALGDCPLQAELMLRLLEAEGRPEDVSGPLRDLVARSGYRLAPAERLLGPDTRTIEERAPAFTTLLRDLSALEPA